LLQAELPASCVWLFFCAVAALLLASPLVAPLVAVCSALLLQAVIEPPAMFTGTLALTAVCSAAAVEAAACWVLAAWPDSWNCPLPPHPFSQLELPPFCVWVFSCVVAALLLASPLVAPLVAVCSALLLPAVIDLPAMFTGALPLTAVCAASASDSAACSVSANCIDDWN